MPRRMSRRRRRFFDLLAAASPLQSLNVRIPLPAWVTEVGAWANRQVCRFEAELWLLAAGYSALLAVAHVWVGCKLGDIAHGYSSVLWVWGASGCQILFALWFQRRSVRA